MQESCVLYISVNYWFLLRFCKAFICYPIVVVFIRLTNIVNSSLNYYTLPIPSHQPKSTSVLGEGNVTYKHNVRTRIGTVKTKPRYLNDNEAL